MLPPTLEPPTPVPPTPTVPGTAAPAASMGLAMGAGPTLGGSNAGGRDAWEAGTTALAAQVCGSSSRSRHSAESCTEATGHSDHRATQLSH